MDVIHISEADSARDFPGPMGRVRAGAEIIIENGIYPTAILRAASPSRRSISECIALAKKHEEETGQAPVLDPDFAADMEEIDPRLQCHHRGVPHVSILRRGFDRYQEQVQASGRLPGGAGLGGLRGRRQR